MFRMYLSSFITIFTQMLIFAIFARVVLSWLRITPRGFLFVLIVESTEPILNFFRRIIPPIGGVVDFSPLFAYFAIVLLRNIILHLM